MKILQLLFYLTNTVALYKGVFYIVNTIQSINFLQHASKKLAVSQGKKLTKDFPFIVIALPVLREQAILKQSLQFFSKLHYPKEKLKILVITTQKEILEKKLNSKCLNILAEDLLKQFPEEQIFEKYLGLFPRNKLSWISKKAKKLNKKEILPFLEKEYKRTPTTIDLAKKYCCQLNTELGAKIFVHVHYPKRAGVMAHQLNFAAEHLEKFIGPFNPKEIFLAVYNADSNPHLDTLLHLEYDYLHSKSKEPPRVYQQIAAYIKNFYHYPKTLRGYLLKASSAVQTRWGVGSEISMLKRHWDFWSKKKLGVPLSFWEKIFKEPAAYCVGHGLFIRIDLLREVGGFPTETLNEDLPLGYYLCLKGVGIKPLPALENVENPDTVSALIKQKASWYWGMIDYFDYWRVAPTKAKNVDLLRRSKLAIQGLIRDGLAWGACSIFIGFMFIYPLIYPSLLHVLLSILGLFVYGPLTTLIVLTYVPELFKLSSSSLPKKKEGCINQVLTSIFSIPYLLVSSLGPWKIIRQKIVWKLMDKAPKKEKTER